MRNEKRRRSRADRGEMRKERGLRREDLRERRDGYGREQRKCYRIQDGEEIRKEKEGSKAED